MVISFSFSHCKICDMRDKEQYTEQYIDKEEKMKKKMKGAEIGSK